MEKTDIRVENPTANKEITEKEDLISKFAFIERELYHATMDKIFGNIDSLSRIQETTKDILKDIIGRLIEIEARLDKEAPAKAGDQTEASGCGSKPILQ